MTKIKNISISAFDKAAKENFANITTTQWLDNEITIKQTLPLPDVLAFVDEAVSNCLNETTGYMPELKEFIIRSNILKRYANFNLPDNLEHCYALVCGTNAVEAVLDHINIEQLKNIVKAIDSKLNYLCHTNVAAIEKQMNAVISAFEDMQKKTEAVFSGITDEDISKIAGSINSEKGIDEEKLVNAFIKAKYDGGESADSQ